jgi:hypothetical protein
MSHQLLICAHPWRMIQERQIHWSPEGDKEIPALYRCPVCQSTKSEGDAEKRVVLAILEEER